MTERITPAKVAIRRLKPSTELETIPVSRLARKGTEVLSRITASSEAVAVEVQGVGSMVTLSRRHYDELVELVNQRGAEPEDDGFQRALSERFDSLIATMNHAGAERAVDQALFSDTEQLNASYRPGATETETETETETQLDGQD